MHTETPAAVENAAGQAAQRSPARARIEERDCWPLFGGSGGGEGLGVLLIRKLKDRLSSDVARRH